MDVLSLIGWHHGNQCAGARRGWELLLVRTVASGGIVLPVTPGGSDKTSVGDALINHQRLQAKKGERESSD